MGPSFVGGVILVTGLMSIPHQGPILDLRWTMLLAVRTCALELLLKDNIIPLAPELRQQAWEAILALVILAGTPKTWILHKDLNKTIIPHAHSKCMAPTLAIHKTECTRKVITAQSNRLPYPTIAHDRDEIAPNSGLLSF